MIIVIYSQPDVSDYGIFCQTKPGLPVWQPKFGLAKYSRTTDSLEELTTSITSKLKQIFPDILQLWQLTPTKVEATGQYSLLTAGTKPKFACQLKLIQFGLILYLQDDPVTCHNVSYRMLNCIKFYHIQSKYFEFVTHSFGLGTIVKCAFV